jgi:hypothetical protein
MLDQIEKVFPGLLARLRRLPWVARVVVLLAILAGVPGLAWIYENYRYVDLWLRSELRVPVYALLLAALGVGALATAARWLGRLTRLRRGLRRFLAAWLDFKSEFELLCIRIDAYLITSRDAPKPLEGLEELLPSVSEYWDRRGRLREAIFRVGEDRLKSLRSARWEALKARSALFHERDYLTPFSFLADLRNPIAEWNHHHDEIWQALHLADEFVEHLRFRHPTLK